MAKTASGRAGKPMHCCHLGPCHLSCFMPSFVVACPAYCSMHRLFVGPCLACCSTSRSVVPFPVALCLVIWLSRASVCCSFLDLCLILFCALPCCSVPFLVVPCLAVLSCVMRRLKLIICIRGARSPIPERGIPISNPDVPIADRADWRTGRNIYIYIHCYVGR